MVAWDESATSIACARLRDGVRQLEHALVALRGAPDLWVSPAPGVNRALLRRCAAEIDRRTLEVQRLCTELDDLHDLTLLAGRAYEAASEGVQRLIEHLAGTLAFGAGLALRTAIAAAAATAPAWAPGLLLAAGIGAGAALAIGLVAVPIAARLALADPQRAEELVDLAGDGFRDMLAQAAAVWEHLGEAMLADPAFRAALAIALESIDEALMGFAGVPQVVAEGLGEPAEDAVVFGYLAAAAAGAVSAPLAFAGRARATAVRRIPSPAAPVGDAATAMAVMTEADAPVTIYAFRLPDGRMHYQVFVRGTESWAPSPETGIDGLANLENAASSPARLQGSDAAVAEAMRAAGIDDGDSVDLFGYSQGGAAVANVAASGAFDVRAMLLIGAPVGGTVVPEGIDVLSVAHTGDLTAAADGMADGSIRTVYLENRGSEGSGPMADHSSADYRTTLETARGDMMLDAFSERLALGTAGAVPVQGAAVEVQRVP
ncbi:hypothetical protein ABA31_22270 [Agrococcus baldri]|uniref:Alpha/beta hydrolase n=1 Tax=Agrococcus baldri TaxID=153730 RepID=A0AA87RIE8_9MICO|nr:hypothetical protein ABA31_22270 [Agrococcus baldri]